MARHVRAEVPRWLAAGFGALLLTATGSHANAGAQPPAQVALMSGWKVRRAADAKALASRFFRADLDDSAWETADIQDGKAPFTERLIFYRRWADVPAAWKGKKISIALGGVDDDAVVYVNGRKVGEHKGFDGEFAFDITGCVNCGGRNLVAVLADNSGGGPGGIWRPVSLVLTDEIAKLKAAGDAALRDGLKQIRHRIVYETQRDGNWELFLANADGSGPVNLTRTPTVHELYPRVSPDGAKVCFVADEGTGETKTRNVYYMSLDGTGRTLVAKNARQPCWSADGAAIAYLKGEFEQFCYRDFATKGIVVYDLKTGEHREHPNKGIHHLYNLCWSPNGKWFVATVHAGMGYKHGILAIEANGTKVFNLGIGGCRPDLSPDGTKIAWGVSDWALRVADIDLSGPVPKVTNQHDILTSKKPMKIYHIDWSPDGRYVAFSRGPSRKRLGFAPEMVGIPAKGWNICVADATRKNRWLAITADGNCNKEPDWAPVRK